MILCTVAGGLRRRTLDATASHTGAGGDNGGEPSPPMDPTEDFEPMLALDDAAVQARMAYLEAVQDGLAPFLRAVDPLCEYGVLAWSAKSRCVTSVKPANRDTRPRPATGEAARGEGPDGADADDARRERRGAWPPAASSHARTIPCGRQPTNRPTGPAGLTDRGHARLASAPPRGSADARLPPCPRLLSPGADSGQQGAR